MEAHKRIAALQLPEQVEIKAKEIYDSLAPEIKKGKKLFKVVYLSVSEAYRACDKLYEPKVLQQTLGIKKPNDILKQAGRHGYKPILCHYHPERWLKDHMRLLGICAEHLDDVKEMLDHTLEVNPALNEKNPRTVSAGVVLFYATANGYLSKEDDGEWRKVVEDFVSGVGVSSDLITSMEREVSEAYKK